MKTRRVLTVVVLAVGLVGRASASLTLPYDDTVASAAPAFSVTNTGTGDGVVGKTSAGNKAGVYGWSELGIGVKGFTTSDNEWVSAIYGRSEGAGDGIYGWSLNRYGAVGVTQGAGGARGVWGLAAKTDDVVNYGGYFEAKGGQGRGVYGGAPYMGVKGLASEGGDATNYGGYFEAKGSEGRGVYGEAPYIGVKAKATRDDGLGVYAEGGANGYAGCFVGNVVIKSRSSGAIVAELGEGLDYAEGFDVSSNSGIAPGTVLVIDASNVGKLAVSADAYDSKVAGIVAGAKGLGSGVRLGTNQFDCDVALAGRVYCNVDATETAVAPGDLLTTSATSGYAMKATDHGRAQGAILGKAMEQLEKGKKGQILVLVSLQ